MAIPLAIAPMISQGIAQQMGMATGGLLFFVVY